MIRLLLCFLVLSFTAQAADIDLRAMGGIPIQHEGRIKPLSSFARFEYQFLTDAPYVGADTAMAFLAQTLFDPAEAADAKLITIRNAHTKATLGLPSTDSQFTLTQIIGPLMEHEEQIRAWAMEAPKDLNPDQASLLAVYQKVTSVTQLLRSFTAVLPLTAQLPDGLATRYHLPADKTLSYLDFQQAEEPIRTALGKVLKRKGDKVNQYSKDEQTLAFLSWQLDEIRKGGAGNNLFRVLPTGWGAVWYSPWEMLLAGQGSPESVKALNAWRGMADAYRAKDNAAFNEAASTLNTLIERRPDVSPARLQMEEVYYQWHPVTLSLLLYLGALILLCARRLKPAALTVSAAVFVHGAAIALRIAILERPPVSTLFESILFVGFIAVLCALLSEKRLRNGIGLFLAGILGVLLQLVAIGFAQNGDTLQTLQAVLNTPFWLATHVIVITAGYGLCLLTAMLAHGDLIQRIRKKDHKQLAVPMQIAALCALLLTAVGTILGGLWADQSWGRFWGWDPKENGALLIVLWLVWLLHGKLSGHVKELAYSAGLAALTVVVALAWFGVNLLSTGLHSYGFTSGIANALFGYVVVQGALIAALWWKASRHA